MKYTIMGLVSAVLGLWNVWAWFGGPSVDLLNLSGYWPTVVIVVISAVAVFLGMQARKGETPAKLLGVIGITTGVLNLLMFAWIYLPQLFS